MGARSEDILVSKPSLASAGLFRIKVSILQSGQIVRNLFSSRVQRHPKGNWLKGDRVVAESRSRLRANNLGAEMELEAGKVQNLRVALRRLDGIEVPPNQEFSFWSQIGLPARWKGFVAGRELREGCLIPSIGGGLCQLSNALYDAALSAGFEIIERHAHSKIIPGSLAEVGRDATVFWNYVDLRFKSTLAFRIEGSMTSDELIIRLRSEGSRKRVSLNALPRKLQIAGEGPQSCASCDVRSCFRHIEIENEIADFGRTAYLVDEYWPEFDERINAEKRDKDILGLPLDGKKRNKSNYAWSADGFHKVSESRFATLVRAVRSRRLSSQGAARQRTLLAHDEKLALSFAPLLTKDVSHVAVMQNLLPFLWKEGHLGGRTFDVLMTRLPFADLHNRLDVAYKLHPESETLGDFRADEWLVQAESEALNHARLIVTPHTEVARLFKEKAVLLDWKIPIAKTIPVRGNRVAFPASTVGRKGAYEMRDAARALDLEMVVVGSQLEGGDFWKGINVTFRRFDENWLDSVGLVVLPAFIEHKPRRLLEAVACKVPVIASSACGLGNAQGVKNLPTGNTQELRDEIQKALKRNQEASYAIIRFRRE